MPKWTYSGKGRPKRLPLQADPEDATLEIVTKKLKTSEQKLSPTISTSSMMSNNIFNMLSPNSQEPETFEVKSSRPPAISVIGLSLAELKQKIDDSILQIKDKKSLKFRLTETCIKIYTQTNSEHSKIKAFCDTMSIEHFTHTYEANRKIKFCLYGLPIIETSLIKNALEQQKLNVCDVKLLQSRKRKLPTGQADHNRPSSSQRNCLDDSTNVHNKRIYIVYFLKKEKMRLEHLRQTRELFNCFIKWEYFVNRLDLVTQCSRCQHFGHGTEHCRRKPRCIRCGKGHDSQNCPSLVPTANEQAEMSQNGIAIVKKTTIDKSLLCCANCGEAHTANYGGCPHRQQVILFRKMKLKQHQKVHQTPFNIHSNIDFPPPSAKQSNVKAPVANNVWCQRPTITSPSPNEIFSLSECHQIMKELASKISICKTKAEQFSVIADITFKYLSPGDILNVSP